MPTQRKKLDRVYFTCSCQIPLPLCILKICTYGHHHIVHVICNAVNMFVSRYIISCSPSQCNIRGLNVIHNVALFHHVSFAGTLSISQDIGTGNMAFPVMIRRPTWKSWIRQWALRPHHKKFWHRHSGSDRHRVYWEAYWCNGGGRWHCRYRGSRLCLCTAFWPLWYIVYSIG